MRATYHRHGGVRHFLAAYDLETDRFFGQFVARKDWPAWLAFLKWVRRRYPSRQTLHIVLDNYKPHLKTEVLVWAGAWMLTGASNRKYLWNWQVMPTEQADAGDGL